jgi:CHRD domain-containing protein
VAGPILIPFVPLGADSATGCKPLSPIELALATEITTTPADFYVNVHTTEIPSGAMRGQLSVGSPPGGEAHLLPVPMRAYDSRDAAGPKILPGDIRTISLASGRDEAGASLMAVPPGATAAIVTLTVAETAGNGGFLTIYGAAVPQQPATSSINWKAADQDIAVSSQVAVDSAGRVNVTDGAGGGATHFVIDVIGYLY